MKENIENVDMYEQTTEDSRAYAIYVARNRAIPDFLRDLIVSSNQLIERSFGVLHMNLEIKDLLKQQLWMAL